MNIIGLAHIAIAVFNIEESLKFYRDILGFKVIHTEKLVSEDIELTILEKGDLHIELVKPLSENSTIHQFLIKRGAGIHHIALKVANINEAIQEYTKKGAGFIGEKPRIGANGKKIAFIYPKSTGGVLIELVE